MGCRFRGRLVIRRGEIYWVRLGPTVGSETRKTRPALIVSNDQNNQFANVMTVLPISSRVERVYPFEVRISQGKGGIPDDSKIMANQIRTIDKQRLHGNPLGPALDSETMGQVNEAIKLHLALKDY